MCDGHYAPSHISKQEASLLATRPGAVHFDVFPIAVHLLSSSSSPNNCTTIQNHHHRPPPFLIIFPKQLHHYPNITIIAMPPLPESQQAWLPEPRRKLAAAAAITPFSEDEDESPVRRQPRKRRSSARTPVIISDDDDDIVPVVPRKRQSPGCKRCQFVSNSTQKCKPDADANASRNAAVPLQTPEQEPLWTTRLSPPCRDPDRCRQTPKPPSSPFQKES